MDLKEARARLAAVNAERETKRAIEAEANELEALQSEIKLAEAMLRLEDEHGSRNLRVVRTDAGPIVVKRPNHLIYRKFQDAHKTTHEALDRLVRSCLVYPTKAEYETICEVVPAATLLAANAVTALAGVRAEELSGKS